jgi:hypothetical protein
VLGEEAHHETRRAVATLGTSARSHSLLNFRQFSVGCQGFDGVYFLSRGHRSQHQTAIYRTIFASPGSIGNQHHGARAALTFSATFLGARKTLCANVIEQRSLKACGMEGNAAIIEQKCGGLGAGSIHHPPLYDDIAAGDRSV